MIVGRSIEDNDDGIDHTSRRIAFQMWIIGIGAIVLILVYERPVSILVSC